MRPLLPPPVRHRRPLRGVVRLLPRHRGAVPPIDPTDAEGVIRPMDVANHSAAHQNADCLGTAQPTDAAPRQAASRFDVLEPLPQVGG